MKQNYQIYDENEKMMPSLSTIISLKHIFLWQQIFEIDPSTEFLYVKKQEKESEDKFNFLWEDNADFNLKNNFKIYLNNKNQKIEKLILKLKEDTTAKLYNDYMDWAEFDIEFEYMRDVQQKTCNFTLDFIRQKGLNIHNRFEFYHLFRTHLLKTCPQNNNFHNIIESLKNKQNPEIESIYLYDREICPLPLNLDEIEYKIYHDRREMVNIFRTKELAGYLKEQLDNLCQIDPEQLKSSRIDFAINKKSMNFIIHNANGILYAPKEIFNNIFERGKRFSYTFNKREDLYSHKILSKIMLYFLQSSTLDIRSNIDSLSKELYIYNEKIQLMKSVDKQNTLSILKRRI